MEEFNKTETKPNTFLQTQKIILFHSSLPSKNKTTRKMLNPNNLQVPQRLQVTSFTSQGNSVTAWGKNTTSIYIYTNFFLFYRLGESIKPHICCTTHHILISNSVHLIHHLSSSSRVKKTFVLRQSP